MRKVVTALVRSISGSTRRSRAPHPDKAASQVPTSASRQVAGPRAGRRPNSPRSRDERDRAAWRENDQRTEKAHLANRGRQRHQRRARLRRRQDRPPQQPGAAKQRNLHQPIGRHARKAPRIESWRVPEPKDGRMYRDEHEDWQRAARRCGKASARRGATAAINRTWCSTRTENNAEDIAQSGDTKMIEHQPDRRPTRPGVGARARDQQRSQGQRVFRSAAGPNSSASRDHPEERRDRNRR